MVDNIVDKTKNQVEWSLIMEDHGCQPRGAWT